jgi:hypothetical protein
MAHTDVERAAKILVSVFTDPTHPINQLRRPAVRTCQRFGCANTWKSKVALLADKQFCSCECAKLAQEETEKLRALLEQTQPSRLW